LASNLGAFHSEINYVIDVLKQWLNVGITSAPPDLTDELVIYNGEHTVSQTNDIMIHEEFLSNDARTVEF